MSFARRARQPVAVALRVVDVGALRRYLAAIAAVARRGADDPDARETLAAARILRADAARELARLVAK